MLTAIFNHTLVENLRILTNTPFLLLVILVEVFLSNYHHKKVYSFKETATNFLLSLLNGGLDLLDKKTTRFPHLKYDPDKTTGLGGKHVSAIYEDKRGNIWVGTSGGGLSLYDRKKDNFTNYPSKNVFGGFSTKSVIRSICCDHLGKLWIAQFEGVYEFDPVTKIPRPIDLGKATNRNRNRITLFCVFEDSKHRIWVGSDYGLYLYQRESDSFKRFAFGLYALFHLGARNYRKLKTTKTDEPIDPSVKARLATDPKYRPQNLDGIV